jgi:uncharacterized protein YggE
MRWPKGGQKPEDSVLRSTTALLTAWVAVAAFSLPAAAQDTPVLQANGEGIEYVVPDIAIVSIGVTNRNAKASEALSANSTDTARVIATVQAAGVDDKDIGTSGFSVNPVYERSDDNTPRDRLPAIVGYQVSNQVTVTIRDIASSGGILDAVVNAGANQVNGIAFDISDRKAAEEKAMTAAIAEARARGRLMAEAAGVRLVRIVSVNANAGGGRPIMFARMEMADAAAPPVPVMPGQQEINANASLTWEIAPLVDLQ